MSLGLSLANTNGPTIHANNYEGVLGISPSYYSHVEVLAMASKLGPLVVLTAGGCKGCVNGKIIMSKALAN